MLSWCLCMPIASFGALKMTIRYLLLYISLVFYFQLLYQIFPYHFPRSFCCGVICSRSVVSTGDHGGGAAGPGVCLVAPYGHPLHHHPHHQLVLEPQSQMILKNLQLVEHTPSTTNDRKSNDLHKMVFYINQYNMFNILYYLLFKNFHI